MFYIGAELHVGGDQLWLLLNCMLQAACIWNCTQILIQSLTTTVGCRRCICFSAGNRWNCLVHYHHVCEW